MNGFELIPMEFVTVMDFAGISWGQHGGLILDVPCLVTPYDLSILATLEPFPENGSKDLDKLPLVNELTSMGISGYSLHRPEQ